MKTLIFTITILCSIQSLSHAEIVELKDGRKIDLKSNGTYRILNKPDNKPNSSVLVVGRLLEPHTSEFQEKSIRYMPLFKNNTNKTIIGIKFTVEFKDAFGDSILKAPFSGSTEQQIYANSKSNADMFYQFKDNPFIDNQTYDKLLPSVIGRTLIDEVKLIKVIYKRSN